jgi:hypothetical protein
MLQEAPEPPARRNPKAGHKEVTGPARPGHCKRRSEPQRDIDGSQTSELKEHTMRKIIALIALGAALGLAPGAPLAEQGTSSSYGSVGWGPHIPTQELTPFDRRWNHANQSKYQAQDGAEWLRTHGKSPFPF